MNTSILKLEATVIRPKDFDELDGLAASISFPVEYDDEAIGEALGDQDLMPMSSESCTTSLSVCVPNGWIMRILA